MRGTRTGDGEKGFRDPDRQDRTDRFNFRVAVFGNAVSLITTRVGRLYPATRCAILATSASACRQQWQPLRPAVLATPKGFFC